MVKTAPEMIGDALIVLAKRAVSAGKVPAIVLTTSNYRAMLGALSEAGIDAGRVLIIDCVTKNISDESDRENVVFVDSLEDFPQLEISLIKLFESSRNFVLIFDSLDILRLYHRNEAISKIIHSITKVLRKSSATGYYLFGSGLLTKQLSQFFDYYVEIGKE
jgi:KaiC/GvpD/RAD55 family RecA-like ATPase